MTNRSSRRFKDNRDLSVTRSELLGIYERGAGPVAFVDESYGYSKDEHRQKFYIMTAAVVNREDLQRLRNSLDSFEMGPNYFHASEQYRQNPTSLADFLRHINDSYVDNLVTVQTRISDKDIEFNDARDDCLVRLAYELTKGGSDGRVQHIIMESLNQSSNPGRNDQDLRLVASAIHRGLLPRETAMHHASPYAEKLLWLPDAVSWAVRQELMDGNTNWVQGLETVRYVHAIGQELTDTLAVRKQSENGMEDYALKRRSSLVPKQNPGAQNLDGPKAGTDSVSSSSILEPIIERYNSQVRDTDVMASAVADRLGVYKVKPEDKIVQGVARRNERTIVSGVEEYVLPQLKGARKRPSVENLVQQMRQANGNSKEATDKIERLGQRLDEHRGFTADGRNGGRQA